MNFVEKTSTYKELRQDFDLQCLENSRKQERIVELNRKIRELEQTIEDQKKKIEILEGLNDNTRKQKFCKPRSRQSKKI